MGGETLYVLGVTSVVALGLGLGAVEDAEAGHVVHDLPGGQAVEVGPGVLTPVAEHPLQPGAQVRGRGLGIDSMRPNC